MYTGLVLGGFCVLLLGVAIGNSTVRTKQKVVYQDRIVYRDKIVYRDLNKDVEQAWQDSEMVVYQAMHG